MDQKKTIKVSLGTVICIFIIVLLVIALGAMYYYYNHNQSDTNDVNSGVVEKVENNINNEISETKVNKVNKLDENKDIVYASFSKYSSEYSYSIPYINIDSADAKKINDEIESYYKPLVEAEIKNETEGLSVIMYNVKYNSYVNDNVLSLIVSCEYPNDCIGYKVYNLDIYKGTIISNDDILNMKNLNETKFLGLLKEIYEKEFISSYGTKEAFINNLKNAPVGWTESEIQEQTKEYERQLNKTVSSDNYSIKTPIFLNENGKICIVGTIYSMAGAEAYDHIIDTDI